jgi:PAS domain S-box-containing protein
MAPPREPAAPVPILVVDDNFAKRLALKAVLSPLGYRIVEADSGVAALRCVLAENFAVILLDVLMPGMDGFETAALIRQREESEMTPIIFITAYRSDEIVQTDLYAQGAVDFIFAPVPPAELRAKVSVFANLFTRAAGLALQARELQASADQLRLLTDAAPIGIFQTDADHRYVYTNPRWSEITGMPKAAAVGQRWDVIIDADMRAGIVAELAVYAADTGELSQRFAMRHADRGQRTLHVTSRSIADRNGGVAGWVGTLADVTADLGVNASSSKYRDDA